MISVKFTPMYFSLLCHTDNPEPEPMQHSNMINYLLATSSAAGTTNGIASFRRLLFGRVSSESNKSRSCSDISEKSDQEFLKREVVINNSQKGADDNLTATAKSLEPERDDCLCPICIETIGASEMSMKCENTHFFHQSCLTNWIIHQQRQNDGDNLIPRTGHLSYAKYHKPTCPLCRAELEYKAARLLNYLEDPNYNLDERSLVEKFRIRIQLISSLILADRKAVLNASASLLVFMFGIYKGLTLRQWTFTQDVVYFTLPYRLRIFTTFGYVIGLITRAIVILVTSLRGNKGVLL